MTADPAATPPALLDELMAHAIAGDDLDITLDDARNGHYRAEVYREVIERAYAAGRRDAARAVYDLPTGLGDDGWNALADRAGAAGYERRRVLGLRARDNFSTVTVEAAYQHARREAMRVAEGSGSA